VKIEKGDAEHLSREYLALLNAIVDLLLYSFYQSQDALGALLSNGIDKLRESHKSELSAEVDGKKILSLKDGKLFLTKDATPESVTKLNASLQEPRSINGSVGLKHKGQDIYRVHEGAVVADQLRISPASPSEISQSIGEITRSMGQTMASGQQVYLGDRYTYKTAPTGESTILNKNGDLIFQDVHFTERAKQSDKLFLAYLPDKAKEASKKVQQKQQNRIQSQPAQTQVRSMKQ
jgi:hypothetical protein